FSSSPTTPSYIYTLSLHDALPIWYHAVKMAARQERLSKYFQTQRYRPATAKRVARFMDMGETELDALACKVQEDLAVIQRDGERSEEHTSELQSRFDLVCRLLLEK